MDLPKNLTISHRLLEELQDLGDSSDPIGDALSEVIGAIAGLESLIRGGEREPNSDTADTYLVESASYDGRFLREERDQLYAATSDIPAFTNQMVNGLIVVIDKLGARVAALEAQLAAFRN